MYSRKSLFKFFLGTLKKKKKKKTLKPRKKRGR